ncbi:MAG: tetratricopeptide repeat protein [Nitrospinae bacterium]|nr:tetratricopeptide repeat protein [Nitrospinota bacterium]
MKTKIISFLIVLFVIGFWGCVSTQSREALNLYNKGANEYKNKKYNEALEYFEKSLNINKSIGYDEGIARTLDNIGRINKEFGKYDKSLTFFEDALKIDKKLNIPKNIATDLNEIGVVYNSLGQYEKALSYHEDSLKIKRQLNIPQDIAISLNNIGLVYLSEKRYKKAEQKFLETGSNPGLVEVYITTGRNDEAIKLLKEMTPSWNADAPYRLQFHTQHGLTLKGGKDFKEASSEFLKAVSISEEMRQKVKGEKGGFLGAGGAVSIIRAYRGLFSTLSERAISRQEDNPLTPSPINTFGDRFNKGDFSPYGKDLSSAAFYFAESTKGRTLLEAMAESSKKSQRVELPEEIREKEQSILNQLSAIENQWDDAYKRGEDVLRRLKERKDGLNTELNNLITELRQKYPRYPALNYPKPIPPEELPLKDNEVLLEYAIGDDAGYLFVVRKGGVKRLIKIPFSREEIEAKVKAFIEPMNTKQIERFSVKEAKGLYELLLAEAMREVTPSPQSPPIKGGEVASSQGKCVTAK